MVVEWPDKEHLSSKENLQESFDKTYTTISKEIFGDPEKNETPPTVRLVYETVRLPQMRVAVQESATHAKIEVANTLNAPVTNTIVALASLQSREYAHIFSYQGVKYQLFVKYDTTKKEYICRFAEPLQLLVTPSALTPNLAYNPSTKTVTYLDSAWTPQQLKVRHTYATKPYDLGNRTDGDGQQRTRSLTLEWNDIRVRHTKIAAPIDVTDIPDGHLVELRNTQVLTQYGVRSTLVDGVIRLFDRQGNEILVIEPDEYATAMKQIKWLYMHGEVCVAWGKSYRISLTSLGKGRASIDMKLFEGWFTSFDEEVYRYDVAGNEVTNNTFKVAYHEARPDRLQWSVDIIKAWRVLVNIRFATLTPEQQRDLASPDRGTCTMFFPLEGKWKKIVIVNEEWEWSIWMRDLDTWLYNKYVIVKSWIHTTGSRVADVTMNKEHQVDYVRVHQSGVSASVLLDSAFLAKLKKFWSTASKERETADGGKYKIVCKNNNGNLEITVDTLQAPTRPDLVAEAERNKQPIEPIVKPRPGQKDEEEQEPSENDPVTADDEYDDEHADEDPEIVAGPNPWVWTETENMNMLIWWEEVTWFYTKPRLLPGSWPLNLDEVYIKKSGWSFSFRLMEDDRVFDNKLLDINIAWMKIGEIKTIEWPDKKLWKVRLEVYDKKLWFALAAPRSADDGSIETVDGVPVLYNPCYPAGVRTAWIKVSNPNAVQGKTPTSRKVHGWLDIAWTYATKILAATDGEVVYVKNTERNNRPSDFKGNWANKDKRSFWNTVVIMHPGWYFTSYHHLSPEGIMVRPGDKVTAGQHIASMGNSWTVKSSIKSWIHLHLWYYKLDETYVQEAIASGKYANLREDIAKSKSNVSKSKFLRLDPEKYLVDDAPRPPTSPPAPKPAPSRPETGNTHRRREWITPPNAKPFPREVVGDTVDKRFASFVSYMWYDASFLRQLARESSLDPALIPAIIRAEHGKEKPANNNPGNIMKNWSLVSYGSLEEWVRAMAQTLNNRYQWKNMTIGSLNGYGRQIAWLPKCTDNGQYCYAMDTSWAWHKNVTNFMSFVYDKKIDYTYKFRTAARVPQSPEASSTDYLKQQPKSRLPGTFTRRWVEYNGYLPQLVPPVWVDRRHAPWWRLVALKWWQPVLITPHGEVSLSDFRVNIAGKNYSVISDINSRDRLYPKAAQFTLTPL